MRTHLFLKKVWIELGFLFGGTAPCLTFPVLFPAWIKKFGLDLREAIVCYDVIKIEFRSF